MENSKSYWEYHTRQYETPYRSTIAFLDFMSRYVVKTEKATILDVGCGGGANTYLLQDQYPNSKVLGTDYSQDCIDLAKRHGKHIDFLTCDYLELPKKYPAKSFDYLTAIQFFASVSFDIKDFIEVALYLTKKGVFALSLFTEENIQQFTTAHDYSEITDGKHWVGLYKIYSLQRLKTLLSRKVENFEIFYEPFEIDIDLPKPSEKCYGTYTLNIGDKRLQISGYMLMPWYMVYIKLLN